MKNWKILFLPLFLIITSCHSRPTGRTWAIHASIVSEAGAKPGWVIFNQEGIICADCAEDKIPSHANVITYQGYLYPGLIDTHSHAARDTIPKWKHPQNKVFKGWWQVLDDKEHVKYFIDGYYKPLSDPALNCKALQYGMVRAVLGGTTSIQTNNECKDRSLILNQLDLNAGVLSDPHLFDTAPQQEINDLKSALDSGKAHRLFLHLAQGQPDDRRSSHEFAKLESAGLVRPGVVLIHGIALTRQDFKKMAAVGMHLIWSPTSNFDLFHATTKIQAALEENVVVALGPDWGATGSDNLLEELKMAWKYSETTLKRKITPAQLFKMATTDAAKVAGVESHRGKIVSRYSADFFLAPQLDPDPFKSLLKTYPRDIHIVFINGQPVYGDVEELRKWRDSRQLDELTIENEKKALVRKEESFDQLSNDLKAVIPNLAPLIENQEKI